MLKEKLKKLKEYFDSYTAEFEMENKKDQKNIQLKIDHSQRVTADMEAIISSMSLTEAEKKPG